jgi:hypothetical protein
MMLAIFVKAWDSIDSNEESLQYERLRLMIVSVESKMFWNVNKENYTHLIYSKYLKD